MRDRTGHSAGNLVLVGVAMVTALGAAGVWLTCDSHASRRTGESAISALPVRATRPGLRRQARVSPEAAWTVAERTAGMGTPTSGTLTELGGKLVYVLYLRDRDGEAEEVIVDARTGTVVSAHPRPDGRSTGADRGSR